MFPKLFKSLLHGASANLFGSCFPAKQSGKWQPGEKVFPKPLPFSFLQAHIVTTAPSQILEPKVSSADPSVSLLSTAALGPVYLDSLCQQVQHSRRRPLGLGLHPSVGLFICLPPVKLTLVLSLHKLNGWMLLYYCHHPHFFSLEKRLKINES